MDYVSLGRTGVQVSPLCLGCMMFGHKTEEPESVQIIDAALEAGINFIDTADVYAGSRSEQILGNALKQNGQRDRVVLATKVHGHMDRDNPNAGSIHRRHIIEGCEASLRRLQTDYIDLYQLHRPRTNIPLDETLRALDDLIHQGKIRYIGTSMFQAWTLTESLWCAKELGLNRFVCEQPAYNLLDRRPERELVPMARTHGVAIIPWSPLAGGFLSGKYDRQNPSDTEGRMGHGQTWMTDHFVDPAFDVVDRLRQIASELDATPSQVALAWCLQQPGVTSPIIGPRTMAQFQDNLATLELTLTDDHLRQLDEVAPPGGVIVPYYESGNWGWYPHHW